MVVIGLRKSTHTRWYTNSKIVSEMTMAATGKAGRLIEPLGSTTHERAKARSEELPNAKTER